MSHTELRAKKNNVLSSKRKREDDDHGSKPAAKKQVSTRPEQMEYSETVSMMDPAITSDHIAKSLQRHSAESTSIELEEKYIPSKAIRDTTIFNEAHVAKHLPQFLEQFCQGGKEALSNSERNANPHTMIITASGIRAADLARQLRCFGTKDSKIAKLFAKHMKLKESIDFVEKNRIGIAVGTPSRLKELIEQEVMKVDTLKRIVIDGSYVDEKKRTIFDLKEILLPMMDILNNPKIKPRYTTEHGAVEILVF